MENTQEQLYTLLQSIDGVVWEADISMQQFTFISGQVQQLLGFPAEDFLNKKGFWESCIHPDDHEAAGGYRELLNSAAKSHSLEYRMVRADGQIVWIKDHLSAVYKDDKPILLRGIMLDNSIAERLRALERLERDILRLNSGITTSLPDVLYNYLRGLEALFPRMQCSFHHIRNSHIASSISPSLPPAYIAAITGLGVGENEGSCGTAAATKQQVIVGEIATDPRWTKYRDLALGHGLHACWSNPVISADGEVMATLAMYYREPKLPGEEEMEVMERTTALLQIILENRKQTEIISEANLLMLQSQELAHFGNWRWDVKQDVVSWSPALYTIYGLDAKSFKATFGGYQDRLHPDDRIRVYKLIENVLQTGVDAEFEERIIRPDGEIRHLRSWAKLKPDANGLPMEMIGACLDVTERVKQKAVIEEISEENTRMIRAFQALEQSHADNTRMLKIVAHDLRNPIGAIKMSASALLTKAGRPDNELKMLQVIQRSASNSLELVNELLQMQGRPGELRKEPVELGAMLYHCTDLLRHQAEAKAQRIDLRVVPVVIAASREKLWRVISNLVDNAIKFSPSGTTIEVSLETTPQGVVIAVSDQGIGIPEEMTDNLFQMFTETKRTGTSGEPSFGLGLAICKQIVEAHSGRIWLESERDKGTTFFVELPLE